jgi:drug/metabolite transporter superfamily protein YnfA
MTRSSLIAVGAVLIIFGGVFFLQGVDVLGGSGMSGKTVWAILGPVIALLGAATLVAGLRRSR